MERELSPEEQAFVNRLKTERATPAPEVQAEVVEAKKRDRGSKIFRAWISLLVGLPLILSALFLIEMQRFSGLFTNQLTEQLAQDGSSFGEIVAGTPLEGLELFYELYLARYYVVAGIVTFFVILIGLSLAIRIFVTEGKKRLK